ncbi:MAG: C39 family peptidase [Patescibacteria group bacterium]
MAKRLGVSILILIAVCAVVFRGQIRDSYIEWSKPAVPSEQPRPTPIASRVGTPIPMPTPTVTPVNGVINLGVQFFSQAPRGDWSLPWQEACEEASAILVGAYLTGEQLTTDTMEQRIVAAVQWQKDRYGYYEHTTARQTADMIKALYGFKDVRVEYNIGIERIAEHVRAGRPVIVPLAGRLLGNPYYTQPGPAYHMLVVKGVTADGSIITNDVGTRHGRNLIYAPDVFLNAMHDVPEGGASWGEGVDPAVYIKTGKRAIIVVYPN